MTPVDGAADGPPAGGAGAGAGGATAGAPRFDTASLRSSQPTVVRVARIADGVEIAFGVAATRDHCPGGIAADLAHRVHVGLDAARQLEEALTRVLALPGPPR